MAPIGPYKEDSPDGLQYPERQLLGKFRVQISVTHRKGGSHLSAAARLEIYLSSIYLGTLRISTVGPPRKNPVTLGAVPDPPASSIVVLKMYLLC